jgi:hypothetical protein
MSFRDEIESLIPRAASMQYEIDEARSARRAAEAAAPLSPQEQNRIRLNQIQKTLSATTLSLLAKHNVPMRNIWGHRYINPSGRQYHGQDEPTMTGRGYHIVRQRFSGQSSGEYGEPAGPFRVDDSLALTTGGDLTRFSGDITQGRHFYDRTKPGHTRREVV